MRKSSALKSSALVLGLTMALTIGSAVKAQTPGQIPGEGGPKIGAGMICDSETQAARFVELRAAGRKAEDAMAAVNKESHNPNACGLATIAFVQDAMLTSKPVDNKLVQVVRINIVAGYTGQGWQSVSNFVQYAVIEAEGISI